MSKHFTHLHLHTEYSLLDGAIRLKDLIRHAQEHEWKAVGISDHGNIFGAVKFFQEAKRGGIKPILGCEMYLTPDVSIKDAKEKYFHLLVIVQNREGYKNLCRLMAYSYQEGFYFKPRIDYKAIEKYHKGLIFSTACVGGHIPTLLREGKDEEAKRWMKWNFDLLGKDRFFFELMPPDIDKQIVVNQKLLQYSKELGASCIVTGDAHYLCEEDQEAHEILLAVQTKSLLSDPDRYTFGDFKGYLKSPEFMLSCFPDNQDAVWRTGEIADTCEFDFETDKLFFPKYPIPQQHTEDSFFEHLCWQGLEDLIREGLIPEDQLDLYKARLKEEVELIINMGYVGYFLIVGDFIRWAKKESIPVGPGRGSAAGSLVAWALRITNVDPIRYNLLFERFLNPERVSMPDIDIDFCIEGREKVIQYVRDKYGHDSVCQIITFGTMLAKGVIKDVARTLGFPFQDANNLTNLIPEQLKITLKEAMEQEPRIKDMMDKNPEINRLMNICFKLEGLTRHASKHAAGVVISPEPLKDVLPLYIPSKTDELVTQYAMTELETLGFLKMDFLGLKNLTVIDRTLKAIQKNHNVSINLDTLPLDDEPTFALLAKGKTSGIFQFESSGIKDVMCRLVPSRFEDLIAVNALYRPGPLGSGMVDDFIERKHGRKKTTYMFKELEDVLSETYGVIVYQEQVMKIASVIAGYSLGGADILRRAMGKKKAEVMAEQKEAFVKGAISRSFDAKKAGELFDLMAYFAGYGFNKSHSTAYALIAYQTAYLKTHYTTEFMASVLSFETHDQEKLRFYLQETQEMGIPILPPSINKSGAEFTPTPTGILFGLKGIKNVGDTAIETILKEREKGSFKDLLDFCIRIDLRVVNKRIMENLVYSGAFDELPGNRAQKLHEMERIITKAQQEKERARTGQMALFGAPASSSGAPNNEIYTYESREDLSTQEKLEHEREMIGFYVSAHPLDKFKPLIKALGLRDHATTVELIASKTITKECFFASCSLLQTHKVITTKKGDRMAFATFEDMSGPAEVVIFPKTFKHVEPYLLMYSEFLVLGALDITSTQLCKVKAQTLIPLERLDDEHCFTSAHITLPASLEASQLEALAQLCLPGRTRLILTIEERDTPLQVEVKQTIKVTHKLISWLQEAELPFTLNLQE